MTPGCEPVRSAHKRHMPHFQTYPLGLTAVMHEIHQESIPFRNDCGSMATLIKGFQELLCIELILLGQFKVPAHQQRDVYLPCFSLYMHCRGAGRNFKVQEVTLQN